MIAGDLDRLTPPTHARAIAAALPRLERLIVLRDTGHMSPLERPKEVTEALIELAPGVGLCGTSVAVQPRASTQYRSSGMGSLGG